jgi:HEAT repeat protein
MEYGKGKRRELKRMVRDIICSKGDLDWLYEFSDLDEMGLLNALISLLQETNQKVKWRAVQGIGFFVERVAKRDMEKAKNIMRRLMWSLNKDSGGIGWGAPEAMGEIMARHEEIAIEYISIYISYISSESNILDNEILEQGVIWGIGRIAEVRREILKARDIGGHLVGFLKSSNPLTRALAARALGLLGYEGARDSIEGLLSDERLINIYKNGDISTCRVNDIAMEAINLINQ